MKEIVFSYDTKEFSRVFTTKEINPPLEKTFIVSLENLKIVRSLEEEFGKLENVPESKTVAGHPFDLSKDEVTLQKTGRSHPKAVPNLNKTIQLPVRELFYNFLTPLVD